MPLGQGTNFLQDEQDYSAFGSLTWNATERLSVTGGLRASWVKKDFGWHLYFGTATQAYGGVTALPSNLMPLASTLGLGTAGAVGGDRDDHAVMPSAKVQYRIRPAAMAYFSYAKGFKAGGFNAADNSANPANYPFGPEHVNAYEVGLKSEWFDRRVLLNTSLFRSDYTDLQVVANLPTLANVLSVVRNAAQARSQGVELESQWAVSSSLRFAVDFNYVDAYYVQYANGGSTSLQQLRGIRIQNLSGRPTQFAPRNTGSVTGTYQFTLPGEYRLITELRGIFSSSYYLTASDDDLLRQGSYARVDGRLAFESSDRRWGVDLIGKNLSDQKILVLGTTWPTTVGSVQLQKEQPRNVALQFRYHW